MADEQRSIGIRGRERARSNGGALDTRRDERRGRDDRHDVRERRGFGLVRGRRLRSRRERRDLAAALRADCRDRRRLVVLRLRGAAARGADLAVHAAQEARARERRRWQEHRQRQQGQDHAPHYDPTLVAGSGFRKRAIWRAGECLCKCSLIQQFGQTGCVISRFELHSKPPGFEYAASLTSGLQTKPLGIGSNG